MVNQVIPLLEGQECGRKIVLQMKKWERDDVQQLEYSQSIRFRK